MTTVQIVVLMCNAATVIFVILTIRNLKRIRKRQEDYDEAMKRLSERKDKL